MECDAVVSSLWFGNPCKAVDGLMCQVISEDHLGVLYNLIREGNIEDIQVSNVANFAPILIECSKVMQ